MREFAPPPQGSTEAASWIFPGGSELGAPLLGSDYGDSDGDTDYGEGFLGNVGEQRPLALGRHVAGAGGMMTTPESPTLVDIAARAAITRCA